MHLSILTHDFFHTDLFCQDWQTLESWDIQFHASMADSRAALDRPAALVQAPRMYAENLKSIEDEYDRRKYDTWLIIIIFAIQGFNCQATAQGPLSATEDASSPKVTKKVFFDIKQGSKDLGRVTIGLYGKHLLIDAKGPPLYINDGRSWLALGTASAPLQKGLIFRVSKDKELCTHFESFEGAYIWFSLTIWSFIVWAAYIQKIVLHKQEQHYALRIFDVI